MAAILIVLTACSCPEYSNERVQGTWILDHLHHSEVTRFDGEGILALNPDLTFASSFSYFFYGDTSNADSALTGDWVYSTACYRFTIVSEELALSTAETANHWTIRVTDSTLTLTGENGSMWRRLEKNN